MSDICSFNIRKISNGYLLSYMDKRETRKETFFGTWKELRAQVGYTLEEVGRHSKFD